MIIQDLFCETTLVVLTIILFAKYSNVLSVLDLTTNFVSSGASIFTGLLRQQRTLANKLAEDLIELNSGRYFGYCPLMPDLQPIHNSKKKFLMFRKDEDKTRLFAVDPEKLNKQLESGPTGQTKSKDDYRVELVASEGSF